MKSLGTFLGLAIVAAHVYFLLRVKHHYDLSQNGGPRAPDWVQLWIPIFLLTIALESIYLWFTKRQPFRINDSIASLGTGLVMETSHKQAAMLLALFPYAFIHQHYRIMDVPDSWTSWLLMFLAVEFGYYWHHRTSHTIATFWAAHHVHHSSEEYTLATALRQSSVQSIFSCFYYLPFAFFFRPELFIAHSQFNLLYQYWIHTEAIPKLGPLELFLNTPSQHRVHHARNALYVDKVNEREEWLSGFILFYLFIY